MGKDKKTRMSILMPSTTRGGKDLSTRPQFSPHVATDVPKELSVFFPSSPLSRSSIDTDITFLKMDTVSDEPCDLSGMLPKL
jgi:hypothetical protein